MYLDNSIIVLIALYTLKDDTNSVTFRHLQQFLPLEKSHISQTLAHNKKKNLIQKPEGKKYFSIIQITTSGIQQAERHISFLRKLLNSPEIIPKKS